MSRIIVISRHPTSCGKKYDCCLLVFKFKGIENYWAKEWLVKFAFVVTIWNFQDYTNEKFPSNKKWSSSCPFFFWPKVEYNVFDKEDPFLRSNCTLITYKICPPSCQKIFGYWCSFRCCWSNLHLNHIISTSFKVIQIGFWLMIEGTTSFFTIIKPRLTKKEQVDCIKSLRF